MMNAILRLRRDNDFNYNKIKDTFIPANGEICLVDTSKNGLCAVCGDGITPFSQLKYINEIIKRGYYYNSNFYRDSEYLEEFEKNEFSLYLDKDSSLLYYYNGESFLPITEKIPTATATVKGIVKMYDTVGENTDGTMTQKAISEGLNKKVEMTLKEDEELVIFNI